MLEFFFRERSLGSPGGWGGRATQRALVSSISPGGLLVQCLPTAAAALEGDLELSVSTAHFTARRLVCLARMVCLVQKLALISRHVSSSKHTRRTPPPHSLCGRPFCMQRAVPFAGTTQGCQGLVWSEKVCRGWCVYPAGCLSQPRIEKTDQIARLWRYSCWGL
jgi:hypothetical protein